MLIVGIASACSQSNIDGATGTIGQSPETSPGGSISDGGGTSAGGAVEYENTTASRFPVGQEWREQTPLKGELENVYHIAFDEWQRRISGCMRNSGFDYTPRAYISDMQTEVHRLLNPLNGQVGARWGYHLPTFPEPEDPNVGSSEFYEALDGPEDNQDAGCAAQAYKMTYPAVDSLIALFQPLLYDLDSRLVAYHSSPEGLAAQQTWSDCMAQSGYVYRSRDEAEGQFTSVADVSEQERLVRSADLACDVEHHLTQSRSEWERLQFEDWASETAPQWDVVAQEIEAVIDELSRLASLPV